MKAATIILALAGAVMAQNFDGQPACATDCLKTAISAAGCAASDVACQCGPTKAAIGTAAIPCLLAACTVQADLIQAQSAGDAQCSKFSATATAKVTPTGSGTADNTITSAPTTGTTGTVAPQTTTTTSGNAAGAAATPMVMGAGALAALLGAVAAL